jgi:hypothetical protein
MALGWTGSQTIVDVDFDGGWQTSNPNLGDTAGLSCASPTDCIAIGHAKVGALQYNGKSWHVALALANSTFLSVACQAVSLCTLASAQDLYILNGSSPTVVQITGAGQGQQEFACGSSSFCLGAGSVGVSPEETSAAEFHNGLWTKSSMRQPDLDNHVNAVACTPPSECIVVGYGYDDLTSDGVLVEQLNGTTWSVPDAPNPAGAGADPSFDSLMSITCSAGSALCSAVGNNSDAPGFAFVELGPQRGATWSSVVVPALGPDPSVSCPSVTMCVAAGASTSDGRQITYLETWSGKSWVRD